MLTFICGILCFVLWLPGTSYATIILFSLLNGAVFGLFWVVSQFSVDGLTRTLIRAYSQDHRPSMRRSRWSCRTFFSALPILDNHYSSSDIMCEKRGSSIRYFALFRFHLPPAMSSAPDHIDTSLNVRPLTLRIDSLRNHRPQASAHGLRSRVFKSSDLCWSGLHLCKCLHLSGLTYQESTSKGVKRLIQWLFFHRHTNSDSKFPILFSFFLRESFSLYFRLNFPSESIQSNVPTIYMLYPLKA